MLSQAENELITRTGRETPMGELFRRFWAPALLESELSGPDSTPVRVQILGEKLVAFRDSAGKIGLLGAYCPHRRANLFWGRNEEQGLRCIYHGWKFDVTGQCVDMPNCPEGVTLKERIKTTSYPTLVRGGIVWAYLGPPDLIPEFPNIEVFHTPPENRYIEKIVQRGNYLQLMEGDVDSSHVSFLHSSIDNTPLPGSRTNPNTFYDKMPRWFPQKTPYGLMLSAQRNAGPDHFQWRVNQYLMPYCTLIAAPPGLPVLAQLRVPIDDEHAILYRSFAHAERPLTAQELDTIRAGVIFPEMKPGTFEMKESTENDYLVDRDVQRTQTFTGIKSIVAQDLAVVQDQGGGPTADRSKEYLVSSDRAIIMLRKRLLNAAKALQDGVEPPETRNAKAYCVRPGDFMLPRDVPVDEGGRDVLFEFAVR